MNPLKSLNKQFLGEEVNLPVGVLPEDNPIQVCYTYYIGKPRSHRLEFKQNDKVKFEIYLPCYGESILELCAMDMHLKGQKEKCEIKIGFMTRMIFLIKAGRPVFCHDLFKGPASAFKFLNVEATSAYRYLIVYCARSSGDTVALLSSRQGTQSGPFRTGLSVQLKWLVISLKAFDKLIQILEEFINSPQFSSINNET